MRGRDRFSVSIDVLRAIQKEFRPIQIMYRSKVSWKQLITILQELQKRGLVEVQVKQVKKEIPKSGKKPRYALSNRPRLRQRKEYRLTDKGKLFLQKYDEMMVIWGEG